MLLTLAMSVNAFALEVPTDTVVQNLNGSQQAIKTYTIPPDQDPATLIEEPFELEGFLYTFANIVKTENPVEETKVHTEIITIETAKKDLSVVLENLEPTIEYDDGVFKGRLALDHTSRQRLRTDRRTGSPVRWRPHEPQETAKDFGADHGAF